MTDPHPRWLSDAKLLAGVVWQHFREDPAWVLLQGARQLPRKLQSRLAPAPDAKPGVISATLAVAADRPDLARTLIKGHEHRAGFLRTQLGIDAPATNRISLARVAAVRGDLSQAAALGFGHAVARRASSELRMLTPGFRLSPPVALQPTQRQGSSDRPHRVAMILNNSLPYMHSGYAQRTHSMLMAMVESGMEVEAWTRLGWPASVGKLGAARTEVIDGISYHRLSTSALPEAHDERWQRQVDLLFPELLAFGPDLVHATTDFHNGLVAQAVATSLGVPWVYEMRGHIEQSWAAQRPRPWRDMARRSERVLMARDKELELAMAADAVVVLSPVQAHELIQHGVAPERVRVAANGVSSDLLNHAETPIQARRRLGLATDGVWVGTVSSLTNYEGLDTLIQAVALARHGGADVRCAIVGNGAMQPRLEELGRQLDLGGSLVMPGRLPRAEALSWYAALDIFAVPRRDTLLCRMITPMKPLEAMAMGRPVVASDLPALRTIVDDDAGVLVEPSNVEALAGVLVDLAMDVEKRKALGVGAKLVASQRTWAHNAAICDSLYTDLRARRASSDVQ